MKGYQIVVPPQVRIARIVVVEATQGGYNGSLPTLAKSARVDRNVQTSP